MTAEKVKGPASYFPSIEKTYGKLIDHWLALLDGMSGMKHMEAVAILKAEHGMAMATPMPRSPIIVPAALHSSRSCCGARHQTRSIIRFGRWSEAGDENADGMIEGGIAVFVAISA